MRRITRLFALLTASALLASGSVQPAVAQSAVPQSWLFGEWIGGLYPPPSTIPAQECLAQPVIIFTRDIVMRAVITDQQYTQRLVETARVTAAGVEFRFARSLQMSQPTGPFNLSPGGASDAGFGCENPDVLHVQRRSENEIGFPGCPEFPYPLVRCPAR